MSGIRIAATWQPVSMRVLALAGEAASAGRERVRGLSGRAVATLEHALTQQLGNVLVALMTPAAVVALVLGLWRVSADLGWTEAFLIRDGLFSHWQVWIALSIGLKILSSTLLAWTGRIAKVPEEN